MKPFKLKLNIAGGAAQVSKPFIWGLGLVVSLMMQTNSVSANQVKNNWDSWEAMGNGYIGRRKVPENFHMDLNDRKLKGVAERLDRAVALGKRAKKAARANGKAYEEAKFDRQVSALTARKARLSKNRNTFSSALWLRTQDEGLTSVSISEIASITGYDEGKIRRFAYRKQLTITNNDLAVPWLYYPDTDSVLFVGEKYDTFYTDQNAYRLTFKKTKKSSRFGISKSRKGPHGGLDAPFSESLKFEEEPDMFYSLWTVKSEPDADYWFWAYLYGGYKDSIEIPLAVPSPAETGTAQIRVSLRGWTNIVDGNDHEVLAELNGVQVGSNLSWDAFDAAVLVAEFDQALLNADGNNELVIKNQYKAGTHPGQWLDQVEVGYERQPVAQNGKLWMRSVAKGVQTVSGFSSDEILVIRNPLGKPTAKRDITIYEEADGSFSVSFAVKKNNENFLISEIGAVAGTFIEEDVPSGLRNSDNAADYLIIASREFEQTAVQLKSYRENSFGSVKIAWMDDIYDEFNAGRQDPFATTRFIDFAKSKWQQAPSIVMVLGKGSIDHKDRMGYSDSFVPVVLTDTPWSLTASDDRLLSGAAIADFAIGRLPITSDEQGLDYLEKLSRYETNISSPPNSNSVLVADNPDSAGDFHANSDYLAGRLVDEFNFDNVEKNYHPQSPSIRSQMLLDATWEAGLVSYDGHGSATQVGDGNESFILASEAETLRNSFTPVFVALTCSAGDFSLPGVKSLADALVLNPNGGAISALSPTGLSLDRDAQIMGNAFFDSLYVSNSRIGAAVLDAKVGTEGSISNFMRRMYSVIGEPAIYAR